jgi:hypothetical protein
MRKSRARLRRLFGDKGGDVEGFGEAVVRTTG